MRCLAMGSPVLFVQPLFCLLQKTLVSSPKPTHCCKKMTTDSSLLNLMSSFAAVVKAGSFTRAAARLDLSKSVVSRHVSALEKTLGVQLLYRSTHGLSLTEAGERFQLHCRDLEHGGHPEAARRRKFSRIGVERGVAGWAARQPGETGGAQRQRGHQQGFPADECLAGGAGHRDRARSDVRAVLEPAATARGARG